MGHPPAEQGDAVAQQSLGYMYSTGRGVPLDRNEAIVWYRKAANQGDVKSKHALQSWRTTGGLMGTKTFELLTALIGFPVGLWLLRFPIATKETARLAARSDSRFRGGFLVRCRLEPLRFCSRRAILSISRFLPHHKIVSQFSRNSDNNHRGSTLQETAD